MMGVLKDFLRSRKTKNLRGNLIPKRGNQQYYKGKGVQKTGIITKHGRFVPYHDMEKRLDYMIPDLTDFKLKPYVAHNTPLAPKS